MVMDSPFVKRSEEGTGKSDSRTRQAAGCPGRARDLFLAGKVGYSGRMRELDSILALPVREPAPGWSKVHWAMGSIDGRGSRSFCTSWARPERVARARMKWGRKSAIKFNYTWNEEETLAKKCSFFWGRVL